MQTGHDGEFCYIHTHIHTTPSRLTFRNEYAGSTVPDKRQPWLVFHVVRLHAELNFSHHPPSSRQFCRSHNITRIPHIHRLSILTPIRLDLHVDHAQIIHARRRPVARRRVAIAQHGPEDIIHALIPVRLLRAAGVRREVEAHGAHVGAGGGGPDPGCVLHGWVGELVADGGYGFECAGGEVEVCVGVVVEALDGIRGGGCRLEDGDVAGVACGIGCGLSGGSAGVGHDGWRVQVDSSVDTRGTDFVFGIVGHSADVG